MNKARIVIDTNILISYVLKPNSCLRHDVDYALKSCKLLISQGCFDELRNVIERFVKKGFVTIQESAEFLGSIVEVAEWIKIIEPIKACRDPKDDKFLELAVNGQAEYLITGDQDLLVLHPFRKTQILTVKDFIAIL